MAFARSMLFVVGLLCFHQACAKENAVSKVVLSVNPIRRVVTGLAEPDRLMGLRPYSNTANKRGALFFVLAGQPPLPRHPQGRGGQQDMTITIPPGGGGPEPLSIYDPSSCDLMSLNMDRVSHVAKYQNYTQQAPTFKQTMYTLAK